MGVTDCRERTILLMDLVRPLPSGPLDVIGDVHGEVDALHDLMQTRLGYRADGSHPEGRHAVFVGDLVDRGEDSLAVARLVRGWIESGRASCVLGNHELNLLLGKRRSGNEWFYGEPQAMTGTGAWIPQRLLGTEAERAELLEFLETLPLALERADLRVVHACWQRESVDALRTARGSARERFHAAREHVESALIARGVHPDMIDADVERQNANPVAVCTSGLERPAAAPFRAGGRMRRVERVAWWQDYDEEPAVVFGHYWRGLVESDWPAARGPYLFAGTPPEAALGPRRNAYCVDYGVGYRNPGRARGDAQGKRNALAALRWPEREVVTDTGGGWKAH